MSVDYWDGEWPNLNSISIAIAPQSAGLTPAEMGILYRLVWHCASRCVHSAYSEPSGVPEIPLDEERIARIAGCSLSEWREASEAVLQHFDFVPGAIRLRNTEVVRLSRPGRAPIPTSTQLAAAARDGARCVYCGCDKGPFHKDHLWPVSKGGSNEPSNIVTACAPCNLSKGDKTLREWMESRHE